jgi:hypothetical protein
VEGGYPGFVMDMLASTPPEAITEHPLFYRCAPRMHACMHHPISQLCLRMHACMHACITRSYTDARACSMHTCLCT